MVATYSELLLPVFARAEEAGSAAADAMMLVSTSDATVKARGLMERSTVLVSISMRPIPLAE